MKKLPPLDAFILRQPSTDQGTLGVLTIPEVNFKCFTIELPWLDNANGISCVPIGIYKLILRWSDHWKSYVYQFVRVPGRTAVQAHWGNVAGDKSKNFKSHSKGCVLLGSMVCQIWGQLAVGNSKNTFRKFLAATYGRDLLLEIREA
ncbi:DUF5675 family protein [Maridesulfovibrio ferrireducens]|uniref:DUF5675 family protein n=1 Tax=Maridesulfovibrio ferrireducens TaxID=246191 RepID=UPI001A2FC385|nr:DUF5675 family protein [Maridesulfovibrio ferrireducens]MBI9110329.1 hypothetical protein [Maridesulfovibrio ferrireducens]